MSATTFMTQKQLMSKNMPADAMNNPFAQQQKILLYVFPLVFAVSGVNFPIGVLLYWLTTNLWSMGQQFYVIRRNPAPGSPAAEALERRKAAKAARHHDGARRAAAAGGAATAVDDATPRRRRAERPAPAAQADQEAEGRRPADRRQARRQRARRGRAAAGRRRRPRPEPRRRPSAHRPTCAEHHLEDDRDDRVARDR